jgi:hypothetical protein
MEVVLSWKYSTHKEIRNARVIMVGNLLRLDDNNKIMLWETARVEQIQRLSKRGLWCENKNVLVIHLDGLTIRVKEKTM